MITWSRPRPRSIRTRRCRFDRVDRGLLILSVISVSGHLLRGRAREDGHNGDTLGKSIRSEGRRSGAKYAARPLIIEDDGNRGPAIYGCFALTQIKITLTTPSLNFHQWQSRQPHRSVTSVSRRSQPARHPLRTLADAHRTPAKALPWHIRARKHHRPHRSMITTRAREEDPQLSAPSSLGPRPRSAARGWAFAFAPIR
jgi:hypothetical protein